MISRAPLILMALALPACTVGPDYVRPAAAVPASYKAAEGWSVATPADHIDRGDWWTLFGDPVLNDLATRAEASNQTLAAAVATYAQARAITRETRSALFPTIDLNGQVNRQVQGGSERVVTDPTTGQIITVSGSSRTTRLRAGIGASWEPDLFGRISRSVENARANADVSAADLASSRLAIQGELATNYLSMRAADAEIALLERTVAGYERALTIARNRYNAGLVVHTDVFDAESQLASTKATLEGVGRNRRTFENAIAVLVGTPPGDFRLAAIPWKPTVPTVPVGLPSTLLERRPDIASAERSVAAANALVGVQQAAFFPTLVLSGDLNQNASTISELFSAAANVWSLGASLAQTIFDAGARSARVQQARAQYDVAVANYRQTVLVAFQDVEDQLYAAQVLARQEALQRQASVAADRSEATLLNRYQSGQITYIDVVQAQATALNARRALVQAAIDRQTATVALIQAVGGGWSVGGVADGVP